MDYIGHGWGMGFGMWFIPLLFILLVVYVLKENNKSKEKDPSAQDILDKRYANGEIKTQEYEEKSKALKKKV
jgi:putative membrane protein